MFKVKNLKFDIFEMSWIEIIWLYLMKSLFLAQLCDLLWLNWIFIIIVIIINMILIMKPASVK